MPERRQRSIGGPSQAGDVGKPGYATPGNHAQTPTPPRDARVRGPGKGEQGKVVCPSCAAEVTTKIADFSDREAGIKTAVTRLVSPHRPGGGRVSVIRGDVICPASLTPAIG